MNRSEYESNYWEGIGYRAMRLALTRTLAEEEAVKADFGKEGWKLVVTEVGGKSSRDFQEKINRAVVGASLNSAVIEKLPHEMHALLHACEEAKRGVFINVASDTDLALKVAIIRKQHWLAVAMFGESAIHPMSSHERCGLGVMNV
ncbi:HutP family protein [Hominifimenecus sp. rT4P-3]|uniref:HutP family protein n=1 Tax=Hominifimenecus sp. rT4P-3 TaxID=3242979 RepID=UPI003DA5C029